MSTRVGAAHIDLSINTRRPLEQLQQFARLAQQALSPLASPINIKISATGAGQEAAARAKKVIDEVAAAEQKAAQEGQALMRARRDTQALNDRLAREAAARAQSLLRDAQAAERRAHEEGMQRLKNIRATQALNSQIARQAAQQERAAEKARAEEIDRVRLSLSRLRAGYDDGLISVGRFHQGNLKLLATVREMGQRADFTTRQLKQLADLEQRLAREGNTVAGVVNTAGFSGNVVNALQAVLPGLQKSVVALSPSLGAAALNSGLLATNFTAVGAAAGPMGIAVAGAAAVITAATAGIVSSVNSYADLEKALNGLKASSGANGSELKALQTEAENTATKYGLLTREVIAAQEELSKGGVDIKDIAGGTTEAVAVLAKATGVTLKEAIDIAIPAMNVWSLKGSQMMQLADVISNGANKSALDVAGMAMSLQQAAGAAESAGLSFEETTAVLALLADRGIQGSDAGTSLRTMLERLKAPTNDATAEMNKYNLAVFDQQGRQRDMITVLGEVVGAMDKMTDTERASFAQVVFGTDAQRSLTAAWKEGTSTLSSYIKGMSEMGTGQENARTRMEGLRGAQDRFNSSLDLFKTKVGEYFAPAMTTLVEAATDGIEKLNTLFDWLKKIREEREALEDTAQQKALDEKVQQLNAARSELRNLRVTRDSQVKIHGEASPAIAAKIAKQEDQIAELERDVRQARADAQRAERERYEERRAAVQASGRVLGPQLGAGPTLIQPLIQQLGVNRYPISQEFGANPNRFGYGGAGHRGIDVATPLGTQVRAAFDATVYYGEDRDAKGNLIGYGKYLKLIDEKGQALIMAHLGSLDKALQEQIKVYGSAKVKAGTALALTGNTGNSTGPHLHLEGRTADNRQLDPRTVVYAGTPGQPELGGGDTSDEEGAPGLDKKKLAEYNLTVADWLKNQARAIELAREAKKAESDLTGVRGLQVAAAMRRWAGEDKARQASYDLAVSLLRKQDKEEKETDLQREQRLRREEEATRRVEAAIRNKSEAQLKGLIARGVQQEGDLQKINLAEKELERRGQIEEKQRKEAEEARKKAAREAEQDAEERARKVRQLRDEYSRLADSMRSKILSGRVESEDLIEYSRRMDDVTDKVQAAGLGQDKYLKGALANAEAIRQQGIDAQIASGAFDGMTDSHNRAADATHEYSVTLERALEHLPTAAEETEAYVRVLEELAEEGKIAAETVAAVKQAIADRTVVWTLEAEAIERVTREGMEAAEALTGMGDTEGAMAALYETLDDLYTRLDDGEDVAASIDAVIDRLNKLGTALQLDSEFGTFVAGLSGTVDKQIAAVVEKLDDPNLSNEFATKLRGYLGELRSQLPQFDDPYAKGYIPGPDGFKANLDAPGIEEITKARDLLAALEQETDPARLQGLMGEIADLLASEVGQALPKATRDGLEQGVKDAQGYIDILSNITEDAVVDGHNRAPEGAKANPLPANEFQKWTDEVFSMGRDGLADPTRLAALNESLEEARKNGALTGQELRILLSLITSLSGLKVDPFPDKEVDRFETTIARADELVENFESGAISVSEYARESQNLAEQLLRMAAAAEVAGRADLAEMYRVAAGKLRELIPLQERLAQAFAAASNVMGRNSPLQAGLSSALDGLAAFFSAGGKAGGRGAILQGAAAFVGGLVDVFRTGDEDIDRVVNTFVSGLQGTLMQLAQGNWIGALVSGVATVVATLIDIFQGGANSAKKAAEEIMQATDGVRFFDLSKYAKTVSQDGFWGWLGFKKSEIDQEAVSIAQTLGDAIYTAINTAFMDGIKSGKASFSELGLDVRKDLGQVILQGLIDGFMKGAVMQGILQPFLDAYIEAMKSGNAEALTKAANDIQAAVSSANTALAHFYDTVLVPSSQQMGVFGPDPKSDKVDPGSAGKDLGFTNLRGQLPSLALEGSAAYSRASELMVKAGQLMWDTAQFQANNPVRVQVSTPPPSPPPSVDAMGSARRY